MNETDVMKDMVDPESPTKILRAVYLDEKTDAFYSTNGHLLFVLPKRDLKAENISDEERRMFSSVIPPVDKKPTVRLSVTCLIQILQFFDQASSLDLHITGRHNAVAFTSTEQPGRVAVLMPMREKEE